MLNFFVIESRGFKFLIFGLFLAVFHELELCISYRLPLTLKDTFDTYKKKDFDFSIPLFNNLLNLIFKMD